MRPLRWKVFNDGVDSRWNFLNDGGGQFWMMAWIRRGFAVESFERLQKHWRGLGVDLRWIFLRAFSLIKINVFACIFPPQIYASFHGTFHATVHSMFGALFHDTIRSLVHVLGDYGVVDSAMRAITPEIYTKQLHISLTLRHRVWSCSAEFFCS